MEYSDEWGSIVEEIGDIPEAFHYHYVKDAYEKENHGMVIILLSTFFESFITGQLKIAFKYIKADRKTKGSLKFLEKINFKRRLTLARILNIIDDNQYEIINKVRDARNDFAHDIKSYNLSKQKEILKDVRLKEAIKLYEKLSGISKATSKSIIEVWKS